MPTLRLVGLESREENPDVLPFPKGLGGTGSNAERVIAAVEEALQKAQNDIDELNSLMGPFRMPAPEDDEWPPFAA